MIQVIAALLFAIGLIAVAGLLLKHLQKRGILGGQNNIFQVEEIFHIDQKRKIVSIRRAEKTYIILLGSGETLIDVVETRKITPAVLDFDGGNN